MGFDALLNLLPKPLLVVLLAIVSFFAAKYEVELQSTRVELAQTRTAYATEVAAAAKATLAEQAQARETEHTLQAQADTTQKANDEATTALTAQRDALRLRLKSATAVRLSLACPSAAPAGLKAPTGGGDQPIVSDPTERLVDEAYRGDQVRLGLLECYTMYDAARDALK